MNAVRGWDVGGQTAFSQRDLCWEKDQKARAQSPCHPAAPPPSWPFVSSALGEVQRLRAKEKRKVACHSAPEKGAQRVVRLPIPTGPCCMQVMREKAQGLKGLGSAVGREDLVKQRDPCRRQTGSQDSRPACFAGWALGLCRRAPPPWAQPRPWGSLQLSEPASASPSSLLSSKSSGAGLWGLFLFPSPECALALRIVGAQQIFTSPAAV